MSFRVRRSLVVLVVALSWADAFTDVARAARVATPDAGGMATPTLPVRAPKASGATAADPAPDMWTSSEIEDAKRACQSIATKVAAQFEALPPRREGDCGAPAPLRLESIGDKAPVRFVPAPVVTCDMLEGLAKWIDRGLQPLAEEHLDSAVSEVRVISSYACRTRYGKPGARMSEHAFANALDIAGFSLADGRKVMVLSDWGATKRDLVAAADAKASDEPKAGETPPLPSLPGPAGPAPVQRDSAEAGVPPAPVRSPLRVALGKKRAVAWQTTASPTSAKGRPAGKKRTAKKTAARLTVGQMVPPERDKARFLRESHGVACALFGTTLGPEANEAHRNHFHVDMFPRRNRGYCE